jgi:hypothetical protein
VVLNKSSKASWAMRVGSGVDCAVSSARAMVCHWWWEQSALHIFMLYSLWYEGKK